MMTIFAHRYIVLRDVVKRQIVATRSVQVAVLELMGLVCIAYGLYLAWPPLGWVLAGCSLIAVAYALKGET